MDAPSTGAVLANSLGVIVTSAFSCMWTAAVLQTEPESDTRPTSNDLESGCDDWLHACASSSADGTFSPAKEVICSMAAPKSCSAYLEGKRKLTSSILWSYSGKHQGPIALRGQSAGYVQLTSSVSLMGQLRPSARLSVHNLSVLLGWNTFGWVSAYLVCRAINKARARVSRVARVANDGAVDGNPGTAGGSGGSVGPLSGAVINAAVVADVASKGSASRVRGADAKNVEATGEGEQQAPVSSVSPPPRGANHSADPDSAIDYINNNNGEHGTNNSSDEPPGYPSAKVEKGSLAVGLKPSSTESLARPISASLCEMTPGRGRSPPLESRPPFSPHNISASTMVDSPARFRSKRDIGGKARQTSSKDLNNKHIVDIAGNKKSGNTTQVGSPTRFETRVAVAAGAAPSPGILSPPKLRSTSDNRASASKALADFPPCLRSPTQLQGASSADGLSGPGSLGSEPPGLASFPTSPSYHFSFTYPSRWVVLPNGFTGPTSLHDMSDLDADVPSSAGWGGALTQDLDLDDGDNGGFLHNGSSSSNETPNRSLQTSKGGGLKQRGRWELPEGINVDHVGPEYFLLEDSDDGETRSNGIDSGVAEEKESFTCQIASANTTRQLEDTASSGRIRVGVPEEKGGSTRQILSAQAEHDPNPFCAVSARPPLTAPFCDLSPCRVAPSVSQSRPPVFMQDTSAATRVDSPVRSRSTSDLRCGAREMPIEDYSRGQSPSLAMGKGMAEQEKRGRASPERGARSLDCAVEMTALAALSPGVISPPMFRRGKRVRSTSVFQGKSTHQTSPPPTPRPGHKGAVTANVITVQPKPGGGVSHQSLSLLLSGGAKSMGESGSSNKEGGHDTILSIPAPASRPTGYLSSLSAPSSSKPKAPDKGSGLTIDLRSLLGLGSPNVPATIDSPVVGPKAFSSRSSPSVYDASASATPAAARSSSRARGSDAPAPDSLGSEPPGLASFPSSPSYVFSFTHPSRWVVLPDGFTSSTSLNDLSALDVGVPSSARYGGELTQYLDDGSNGGSSHYNSGVSGNSILNQGVEEVKGDSAEPRASWAPPAGIDVNRLGIESFLLGDSDDGQPRPGGIEEGGT